MKPLYGTHQYVEWLNMEVGENWPTWTCHVCNHQQTGGLIRVCENCNTYPLWKYNATIFVVGKAYLKNTILRVIWSIQGALRKIEKKLLDGDYGV